MTITVLFTDGSAYTFVCHCANNIDQMVKAIVANIDKPFASIEISINNLGPELKV